MPMVRTAKLMDTISASGVEWETQLCFIVFATKGTKERGPTSAKKAPKVERNVSLFPIEIGIRVEPETQIFGSVTEIPGKGRNGGAVDVAHEAAERLVTQLRPLGKTRGQGRDRFEQVPTSHPGSVEDFHQDAGGGVSQLAGVLILGDVEHEFDGIGRHAMRATLLKEPCLAGPRFAHAVRHTRVGPRIRSGGARLGFRGVAATVARTARKALTTDPVR